MSPVLSIQPAPLSYGFHVFTFCIFSMPPKLSRITISLSLIYLLKQYLYNYYLLCINELMAFNEIFTAM